MVIIDETVIPFIDIDDLITNKQAIAREKDITDITELKKRHKKDPKE